MKAFKAFLLAPVAPLLVLVAWAGFEGLSSSPTADAETLVNFSILIFVFGLAVAYGLIIVVAVPVYLLLRQWLPNFLICVTAAALIASLWVFGLEVERLLTIREGSTLTSQFGACETIRDNVRTACGYVDLFKSAGQMALLGAIAGAAFWVVHKNASRIGIRTTLVIFGAIIMVGTGATLLARDRTCHTSYMRGRTHISPDMEIRVDISEEEFPKFLTLFREFADANDLSFRDHSRLEPSSYRVLSASACREGLNYEINEHRVDDMPSFRDADVRIWLMTTDETVDAEPPTRDLIDRIGQTWPRSVQYSIAGSVVSAPDYLKGFEANADLTERKNAH